jgi:hypothetical protein
MPATNKIVAPVRIPYIAQILAGDESPCKVTEVIRRVADDRQELGVGAGTVRRAAQSRAKILCGASFDSGPEVLHV